MNRKYTFFKPTTALMLLSIFFLGFTLQPVVSQVLPADECQFSGMIWNSDSCGMQIHLPDGQLLDIGNDEDWGYYADSTPVKIGYYTLEIAPGPCGQLAYLTCLTPVLPDSNCYAAFEYDFLGILESYPPQYSYVFYDISPENVVERSWYINKEYQGDDDSLVYNFFEPGEYEICLRISTKEGCTEISCQTIYVGDLECQAGFDFYPAEVIIQDELETEIAPSPYVYQFVDKSWGNIENWAWMIDEDSIIGDPNPYYEFPGPGAYEVCLYVSSADGCYSSICNTVYVGEQAECEADFEFFSAAETMPDTFDIAINIQPHPYFYTFVDHSIGNIDHWYWTIGQDSIIDDPNPTYEFPGPGAYEVCLYISSADGCYSSICKTVYVDTTGGECQAAFEYYQPLDYYMDSLNYYGNTLIQFEDYSNGHISDWYWEFGDGTTSGEVSPMHEFPGAGAYEVCLTVSGENNCFDTYCTTVYIEMNGDCDAEFSYCRYPSPTFEYDSTVNETFLIGFKTQSPPTSQSYFWDFGDGRYSYEANPMHLYSSPGYYNVCLTVTSAWCFETYCMTLPLGMDSCDVKFRYELLEPDCQGYPSAFAFTPVASEDIAWYNWRFGDGYTSSTANPFHIYAYKDSFNVCLEVEYLNGCRASYCNVIYNREANSDTMFYKACYATALKEFNNSNIMVTNLYPLPAQNELNFELNSSEEGSVNIELINTLGQVVYSSGTIEIVSGNNNLELNISGVEKGNYIYKLTSDEKILQGRVNILK